MITYEQAREVVEKRIPKDCGIVEERTLEKSFGWYFCYQSNEYLATRDARHPLIGSGGIVVDKLTGRAFEFGSAYSLERNFAAYEAGFKFEKYDLTILRVNDLARTVEFLYELRMSYVIPEIEGGVTWKIPRQYTPELLEKELENIPCTFFKQGFYFSYEVFRDLRAPKCCDYEIREHLESKNQLNYSTFKFFQ